MYWANILHIYQPPTQTQWMIDKIAKESYREIVDILQKNPSAKITLNIAGCLTQKLAESGFFDVIEGFRELARRGQIEFTGSAAYHAFLPLVPKKEALRQIELNEEINKKYFGDVYRPEGFFSPEGGYSDEVASVVRKKGYRWMLVDEVSFSGKIHTHSYRFEVLPGFYSGGRELNLEEFMYLRKGMDFPELVAYDQLYYLEGSQSKKLHLFFRERFLSDAIASGQITEAKTFFDLLENELAAKRYFLTATDGEAYGHHNPALGRVLSDIYKDGRIATVTVSELKNLFRHRQMEVRPLKSTWATSAKEISEQNYYSRWRHLNNEIHDAQWRLARTASDAVNQYSKILKKQGVDKDGDDERAQAWREARHQLDKALHSCHYWWASARPWWSIEMIEAGAWELLHVTELLPKSTTQKRYHKKAKELYAEILFTGFDWMRTGKVNDLSRLHK